MLHLQTIWKKDSKTLDIEYTTPLEQCKNNYYQLTLHSLYGSPIESQPVEIPIKCDIQDGSYISSIDSDEIDFKQNIKAYCEKIVKLLNGQGEGIHRRASKEFKTILTNNHGTPPSANFNDNAQDNVITSRFFNLNLPSNTYLFSTSKFEWVTPFVKRLFWGKR